MNTEANQISNHLPDGKGKHKFLEHVSKCKQSAVQLKINISVRASSDSSDDTVDLDAKIYGLYDQISQSFQVITHSDRVFTDMDLNHQQMKQSLSGGSNEQTWNNINWN
ncbi:hypothetical protein DLAC_02164 [Tieghemostelium lacteum]|uniref:F-actin binding domain-containing protein n=1 Tax=Tieghemostelium lacteum TaxID=361077 RepID=A0A152A4A5_TIELA|nr:hypothetical protein DLAC_02164 [Tieghemostelium lacteum]|eukprot:KYR01070.1 hypothetical protein DLAC_02164 [Tieghemostelium lacteum]